ncbi:salicylate hydroxylase [Pseudohoeflea suaedae]|uniref:Salicylate hydroxylase n=1 Tax=Pseudohoeflea suaedae TaxID=877384 RepID=A0A4R5PQ55_9HYPH|nr:FAD-dependent monooxygenase [Pseudohoeflea suaedae]TDH39236.1 salicylate hydroxylase [Pseudohoeflea suaedae]
MTGTKVDIVGAGMAGLAAALAFSRAGWTVRLRERAEEIREVGAGLQLSPNCTHILHALGLGPALDKVMHRPDRIVLASGITLDTITHVPAGTAAEQRWKSPYGVIHRADLQKLLFQAAENTPTISIETGSRIEPGDLGESDADLVVIADGVWSANRRRLKHAGSPSFTGLVAWRMMVGAQTAVSFIDPHNVTAFMGPESHLVAYPVKGGAKVSMVAITTGEDPGADWSYATSTDNRARLFERFARWHPTLRMTMRDADSVTYWPLYQMSDGAYFDGGKTVLIGDAAHAMVPFAAQGAAMAIEDAWELASAAHEGRTAIFRWEERRRARVARARKRAAFNRFAYHARGPARLARDVVLSLRKPEDLAADLDWLYSWRATGLDA